MANLPTRKSSTGPGAYSRTGIRPPKRAELDFILFHSLRSRVRHTVFPYKTSDHRPQTSDLRPQTSDLTDMADHAYRYFTPSSPTLPRVGFEPTKNFCLITWSTGLTGALRGHDSSYLIVHTFVIYYWYRKIIISYSISNITHILYHYTTQPYCYAFCIDKRLISLNVFPCGKCLRCWRNTMPKLPVKTVELLGNFKNKMFWRFCWNYTICRLFHFSYPNPNPNPNPNPV